MKSGEEPNLESWYDCFSLTDPLRSGRQQDERDFADRKLNPESLPLKLPPLSTSHSVAFRYLMLPFTNILCLLPYTHNRSSTRCIRTPSWARS